MYSNNLPDPSAFGAGYRPYFYASGRYLWQPMSSQGGPSTPVTRSYGSYDFTSDLFRPQGHDHPQTVEQVIARGYLSVPYSDPMTALISDRRHTSWLGLDDLITQVRSRFVIYQRNMYDLDQSVCEAHNGLFRQVAEQGCPANQRQKYAADKQTQKLYEQKREERVNLWKDISRLRLEMPEAAQQYLAAYRKQYFLDSAQGDRP